MSKPRSNTKDFAVYLAVRIVVCILQAMSFRAACKVANGLAWLIYKIDRRHRLVALDNLHHAFGIGDEAERDRFVRGVYRHFCAMLMEIIHVPRLLHPHNWKKHFTLVDSAPLADLLLTDRPVLVVSGHFGNWELGGYVLALFGFRTHAIARPLDNPYVDAFFRRFRERTGQKMLAKHGDFERMQGVLNSNGIMVTLGDQDAGQKGQFVDFFGRPASTHKAVALLALEYNVPMMVLTCTRVSAAGAPGSTNWHYEIAPGDVIDPEEYKGRPDALPAITERFTSALERMIRRAPEQYFWLHRRWKHQPKAKRNKQAAA
ncbi:MAG TPA: lysophospholipid acyltransferase family protein [Gemmataceae bacterium]|nr:lysophospholipid acyltransferase family protein [Gemmataceae bacterium]